MLVGIGTATLVIDAIAQRLANATVIEAVEAAEESEEQDVIVLVRDINERLRQLEATLERQRRVR